jgi:hypothetical protein
MKQVYNFNEELERENVESNQKLRKEIRKKRKEAIRLQRLAKQYTP